MEALATSLMGMFEKRRFKKFLVWVQQFDTAKQDSWQGLDPNINTMQQVCTFLRLIKWLVTTANIAIL